MQVATLIITIVNMLIVIRNKNYSYITVNILQTNIPVFLNPNGFLILLHWLGKKPPLMAAQAIPKKVSFALGNNVP